MAIPDSRKRLTKEMIKDRMRKNAADFWGYQLAQIEGFDPLVEMLMGACSSELKRIHDEIAASQGRILERIAQLLTPDVLAGPLPAHAILHVTPNEPEHLVKKETQFYLNAEEYQVDHPLYFSPIGDFPIKRAPLKYLAFGNSLEEIQGITRERICLADPGKTLSGTSLYLGFEVDPNLASLEQLRLFWDWKIEDRDRKQLLVNLLPSTKCYVGDRQLEKVMGLSLEEESKDHLSSSDSLTESLTNTAHLRLHIEEYYQTRFFSLLFPEDLPDIPELTELYPPAFSAVFPQEFLQGFQEPVLWIRIDFPESYPQEDFFNLIVLSNCFPIYNCQLHNFFYRLQQKINIMPLETEGFFFDIDAVARNDGAEYTPIASVHLNEETPKTYTLRKGGTARFDARDAASIMDYIFDLLRDESAAFTALGYDVLTQDIKSLNQIISRLERKALQKKTHADSLTYLIIRPERTGENIEVTFRSTMGAKGNGLPSGLSLGIYQGKGASFKKGHTFLATRTTGGRNSLSPTESLHAYKEALLNRGRIVSFGDVETVCFSRLGSRLDSVRIERGIKISASSSQGLTRTLDVYLKPKKGHALNQEDCQDLETVLSLRSTSLLPYNVFIDTPA